MKIVNLLLLILFLPIYALSQSTYTLDDCKEKARLNFPKLQQAELLTRISNLKNENTQANYLPKIDLKGQATYQSEVIEINLPIQGFEFDPISKDQYKIYLDVQQTIWDGGLSNSQKEMEMASLNTSLQQIEIEVNQLYSMVEGYCFAVMQVDKSNSILLAQQEVLDRQIERLGNAFELGAAKEKDLMKLKVEKLLVDQKKIELESRKKSIVAVLSLLIGEEISLETQIELPVVSLQANSSLRPELKYFNLQEAQLDRGDRLLDAIRNPKLFGFGQAGYGKPGLNMLKNEFDPYYVVGVGISWRVLDWNSTKRKKEINAQQREIISTFSNDFILKQNIQLAEAAENVERLKQLIQTDNKLVEGRKMIAKRAAAELENGSITSTDYLIDLNAETVAKINHEIHKIQLTQAMVNYNTILGYN